MPIHQVRTPDGQIIKVEAPEGASEDEIIAYAQKNYKPPVKAPAGKTPEARADSLESTLPEWIQDAMKYGPGFLKQQGRNLARGALELPSNTADLLFATPMGQEPSRLAKPVKEGGDLVRSEIRKTFPRTENPTPAEALADKTFEAGGAGGAFGALSGLKSGVLPLLRNSYSGFSGSAVGVPGGEGAKNLALNAGLGETGGGIAEVLGSLLTGGLAGFVTGPRQTSAQSDIRRAAEGADFDAAGRNVDAFNAVGSKTATLGEAFPPGSAMRDLVYEARGGNLSNSIKTRTMGRSEDLTELGQKYLDRIGPEVSVGAVNNRLSEAANGVISSERGRASSQMSNALLGVEVKPVETFSMYRQLMQEARTAKNPSDGQALAEVAQRLLDPRNNNRPVTNVQALSLRIKELKDAAASPNASAGTVISKEAADRAVTRAEELLGQVSPAWKKANEQFAWAQQNLVAPLKEGNVGRIADRNPNVLAPTPLGKMAAVISGNTPGEIDALTSMLRQPAVTGGPTVGPTEIARALAQQKLQGGTTNPGGAIRGNPGSLQESQMNALLASGGKSPAQVNQPLDVADLLQGLPAQAGRNEGPAMKGVQALLRPFRTADMEITGLGIRSTNQQLADYLANPTREGLETLKKLAMFDPTLRRQLTVIAPLLGA